MGLARHGDSFLLVSGRGMVRKPTVQPANGDTSEVNRFDPETGGWVKVGGRLEAREYPAAVVVEKSDFRCA